MSRPRRGRMDSQDRLWFAEWWGDKVGMFDTKAGEFMEWKVPGYYARALRRRARQDRLGVDQQHDG